MKLHVLASKRKSKIPFPESLVLTPASENDLTAFKQNWDNITDKYIFGDKIYSDSEYFNHSKTKSQNLVMITPVKATKGKSESLNFRDKAADDLFSAAVSKIRQPVESFFNWLNEKTNIQRAHKVRSTSGLLIHTMGKIAIAFIYLIFNY